MNRTKSFLSVLARPALGLAMALPLAAGVAVLPAAAADYVMKIGTATPKGDQNVWMQRFKERVEAQTEGRVSIRLFPSSQLGAIPRQIEGMQLGTVESWIGPPGFVKGVEPRYQAVDAPGIFRGKRHAQKTLTDPAFRDEYLGLGKEKGIFGIGIYVPTVLAVVSKTRPIKRLEDFRGQKIRVLASEMEVEAMNRVGAAPTPMPLMEALPALQRGVLDGVRSGLVIFTPFKYWNVAKDLTETHEGILPVVTFVSTRWWEKLPADVQAIMLEEAEKLDDEIFDYALGYNEGLRKTWLENGGRIHRLPEDDQKELMKRMRTVGRDVVADKPGLKKVYDKMVEISKKY